MTSEERFIRNEIRRLRFKRYDARVLDIEITNSKGIELTKTAFLSYYYRIPKYHRPTPEKYHNLYSDFMKIVFLSDSELREWIETIPNCVNRVSDTIAFMKFYFMTYFIIFFESERRDFPDYTYTPIPEVFSPYIEE